MDTKKQAMDTKKKVNPGPRWQIIVKGTTRSYRDDRPTKLHIPARISDKL
jgi:hypothetical protein